ncbi:MAG: NHLP bacteriocin export ABC transporter permease/ATPase subunit [Lachnospiraceae bacterium]|nr:NHLP bacteriocin export ABC transporter permease/ATPase subunit [Lachnospiraceae bacterium]
MGWFDNQIRERKKADRLAFEDSFQDMVASIMGKKMAKLLSEGGHGAEDALEDILAYYHIKALDPPVGLKDQNEVMEYQLRPHGIMRRTVYLEGSWYSDAMGAMLGNLKEDGRVVALIPFGFSGYHYYDHRYKKWVIVNKENAKLLDREALVFYKPFPLEEMGFLKIIKYIFENISVADIALILIISALMTAAGLVVPQLMQILFEDVIPGGSYSVFWALAVYMVCVTLGRIFIQAAQTLISARLSDKVDISVQAATMMRILTLPPSFFKQYSSGELASRAQQVNALTGMILNNGITTGITSIFSLTYIVQILHIAPAMVGPSLIILFLTILLSIANTLMQTRLSRKQMQISSKESGMSYGMIAGIQKIRLSGAEKRAFSRWGKLYAEEAKFMYNPPLFLKINSVLTTAIRLFGTVVLYYVAVTNRVTVADYYSFNASFGMVSGAFMSLSTVALSLARIKPVMEMAKPILQTVPEIAEEKEVLQRIAGGIELNNVSFRYSENSPLVLDNFNLKIRPGQYVAIVGKTGCGKSTLLRIMLGFEKPDRGSVYYDGKDLETIDLKSLRRKIGTVMQNGKLFTGDLYSNIVISAPSLTINDAWEAAELAGIADDIRAMPMKMSTLVSEGQGGISGGQKQRLMIARAVAPKPRILMFDEATSALDNLTQKKVSDALDKLKCTRIVIAHRLSTIKGCDRIIVLDHGHIIEDGKYDELIAKKGFFYELVERQRVDAH